MGLFSMIFGKESPSEQWAKWDNVRGQPAEDRKARGIGGKLTVISIDKDACIGNYVGSDGRTRYKASLQRCTCPDFQKRKVPCKHMYHLAYNFGFDIHPDYTLMMQRAIDHPGYEGVDEYVMQDFYAYRNAFELLLSNKISFIIRKAGGRMTQVDLKQYLNDGELKFYDYTISMMEQNGWIRREKEKGKVIFYA